MDPFIIGSGIGALVNAGSTIMNNRAQRKLSMEMYNLQRKDALADWDRQTAYESPKAQMARYKEAGLNPNLVYGNMQNSPTVRSTPMDVPNLQPVPTPDVGGLLMQHQQIKKQQAQTDLTNQVLSLTAAKESMLALQAYGQTLDNAKKEMSNEQYARLRETYYETSLASLENLQVKNMQGWQNLELGAKTMDSKVELLKKRLVQMDASIGKIAQETIAIREMLPYKKREAEARINNILASTEGKQLDNIFNRMTMANRATAIEFTMELLGKDKTTRDYKNAQMGLQNLLLQNDVDMQGVRNTMEVIGGIKDVINPFKGKTKTTSTRTQTPKGKYSSETTTTEK